MRFFKLFFVICNGFLFIGTINAEIKRTKRLQVVLLTQDPNAFNYILNKGCGNGCTSSIFDPRPLGSYNYVEGQIYPGHTVSKDQFDYSVDRHGRPLTAENSIGRWQCVGQAVHSFDWFNMPDQPTLFEVADWDFFFKENCSNKKNSLYSRGMVVTNVFDPADHKVAINGSFAASNGSGCNKGYHGVYTAKIYVSPNFMVNPTLLIKFKFSEKVAYKR